MKLRTTALAAAAVLALMACGKKEEAAAPRRPQPPRQPLHRWPLPLRPALPTSGSMTSSSPAR